MVGKLALPTLLLLYSSVSVQSSTVFHSAKLTDIMFYTTKLSFSYLMFFMFPKSAFY